MGNLKAAMIAMCIEHILVGFTCGLVGEVNKTGLIVTYEITSTDRDFSDIIEAVRTINLIFDRHYMERCEIEIDNENESACITVYLGKACS